MKELSNSINNILKKFKDKKEWTVLVYGNGNNELEPEIYDVFFKINDEVVSESIRVITQLARAPQSLVKLLRPTLLKTNLDSWHGVKRYETTLEGTTIVEDLGNKNMADPYTLYEFITWGIANYPSNNVMLILSGHGAGFAGMMTDLANDRPFIMSMNGICSAIYNSKQKTNRNIDCILLDACYMNMIEVWYELAFIPDNPVDYILVPSKNVPIEGLPYNLVIRYLQEECNNKKEILEILINTTQSFNLEDKSNKLLVVDLNKSKFASLKDSIDRFSYTHIYKDKKLIEKIKGRMLEPAVNILYLEKIFNKDNNKHEIKEKLKNIIESTEISKYTQEMENGPSVYLPKNNIQYDSVKSYYRNMGFSEKNRWLNIVENRYIRDYYENLDRDNFYDKIPMPRSIPIVDIISVILEQNPNLSQSEAYEIIRELGWRT